jgi:hypothetical protein
MKKPTHKITDNAGTTWAEIRFYAPGQFVIVGDRPTTPAPTEPKIVKLRNVKTDVKIPRAGKPDREPTIREG